MVRRNCPEKNKIMNANQSHATVRCLAMLFVCALFGPAVAEEQSTAPEDAAAADMSVEIRGLVSALEAYPQHEEDIEELYGILADIEQIDTQIAALESGVQQRGTGLTASRINAQIAHQGARLSRLRQDMDALRRQKEQEYMDQSIESAKSNYDEAKEQFKLALRIMDEHRQRQQQVVQKITQ